MKRYHAILIAAAAIGSLAIAGTFDKEDKQVEDAHYCSMVKSYKHTHGKEGWPDFRETYRHDCLGIKE